MQKRIFFLFFLLWTGTVINAQTINEGYLQFRETPEAVSPGSVIPFRLIDKSGKLPDSSLIRVDWLDEAGHLLDYKWLYLIAGGACGVFDNGKIMRGPSLLRAYFLQQGKPMHTARQFVFINNNREALVKSFPDSLLPNYINASFTKPDRTFDMAFFIKGSFPGVNLQYQLADDEGQLVDVAGIERVNDSTLRIRNIDQIGKGSLRVFVTAEQEFKDYDDLRITPAEPIGSIAWNYDSTSKKAMRYVVATLSEEKKNARKTNGESAATFYSKGALESVSVKGTRKTTAQELEDKYVQNGMFKSLNSRSVSVLNDGAANLNVSVFDYIQIRFPELKQVEGGLQYRNGNIQYFLDEVPLDDLSVLNIRDIALIKFVKNSFRGLNPGGGGLAAAAGSNPAGSLNATPVQSRRGSGVAPAPALTGNTGVLVLYTKKGDDKEVDSKRKQISIPFIGIEPLSCK